MNNSRAYNASSQQQARSETRFGWKPFPLVLVGGLIVGAWLLAFPAGCSDANSSKTSAGGDQGTGATDPNDPFASLRGTASSGSRGVLYCDETDLNCCFAFCDNGRIGCGTRDAATVLRWFQNDDRSDLAQCESVTLNAPDECFKVVEIGGNPGSNFYVCRCNGAGGAQYTTISTYDSLQTPACSSGINLPSGHSSYVDFCTSSFNGYLSCSNSVTPPATTNTGGASSTCPSGCQVGSVCCGAPFCSGDCIGTPCC